MLTDSREFLNSRGYLTIAAFTDYLNMYFPERAVSYQTMQRYRERGLINYTKIGGQYRVSKVEVERYIAEGTLVKEGLTASPTLTIAEEAPLANEHEPPRKPL